MLELVRLGMGPLSFMRLVAGRRGLNAAQMIGLTLTDGKRVLAGLQVQLVRGQPEDHCRRRRRCHCCGAAASQRSALPALVSLFATVEIRTPHFTHAGVR
jgi:hypothetical protein